MIQSRDFSIQALITGMLAAFAGFAGSFAVVVQGLVAVGASAEQSGSALMALCIGMGLCGILLSAWLRMPISVAWSTPGAAMLGGSVAHQGGFETAVGAFLICGGLLVLAGFWKPLTRLVRAIPVALASAMLAGVLFGLCLAPVQAVAEYPQWGLPIVVAWLIGLKIDKLLAVPLALLTFLILMFFFMDLSAELSSLFQTASLTRLEFISPAFSISSVLSIALPLFVVTMASQNIPGMGVLQANNYHPDAGRLFSVTGFFSVLTAPFGGHAINLAAITAALCAGEEAHKNPARRYWSAIVTGVCYLLIALFAGFITRLVTLAPSVLIQAVAGLALVSACSGAMVLAFEKAEYRTASAVTFLVTASGLSFAGISGAFWGLFAGWLVLAMHVDRNAH